MVDSHTNKQQVVAELSGIRQHLAQLEQFVAADDNPEQLSSSLFLYIPTAIYVLQDGVFKFVNPKMCEITGYSEDEIIGVSPLKLILSEDKDTIAERAVKLLKGGESSVHEFRVITKNARIKWVAEVACRMSYEGKPAIISSLIEITERKQAEQARGSIEEKYYDLCENASDMIQCITPDGSFTYVNRMWLKVLGYSEDEIIGISLLEILPPDYREHFLELLHRVISGEEIDNIEVIFIHKSGRRIAVEGSMNCRFADGKPVYTRGIFRDVTERKRAQAETEALLGEVKEINRRLEQSNHELEDFARVASHDLQEPLRKISSFGALLQDSLKGRLDEDQSENLAFMVEGAGRMQSMIDALLAYSRITTKAKPFQPVDPNKVVENLNNFELAAALDETKGTILVPQPLLSIYGDPSQIHQLLQNLIANGLKFNRKGISPSVTISSHPMQNNMVRFYVEDNGIGIDEEYHQQIFVMFKRLHSRMLYKGTGIGLAICRKIVQRHGGEIGVKSESNKGSRFWFTLPRDGRSVNNCLGDDQQSE